MRLNDIISTIKSRRESLNVTQETLAELSGVSLRTIKQVEGGKGNPTFETIQKIVDVLGLEVCLKVKEINSSR